MSKAKDSQPEQAFGELKSYSSMERSGQTIVNRCPHSPTPRPGYMSRLLRFARGERPSHNSCRVLAGAFFFALEPPAERAR